MYRRKVDDATCLTWEEALARNDVDAFVISTENCTHEEYARSDNGVKTLDIEGTTDSAYFNTVSILSTAVV